MTTGETQTICGFGLYDQTMCMCLSIAQGKFCAEHNVMTCTGCGKRPTRECPHTNDNETFCKAPLCENCEHRLAVGHGPKITVRTAAYEEMTAALQSSLEDAAAKGMCAITEGRAAELATKILNDFSMHVTMKLLSGIAANPNG
jgi:hypothetical protein